MSFASLLDVLEGLDLASLIDDPPAMAEAMIVRQKALDSLKLLSLSAVSEEERGALRRRIEKLLARDAEILQLLREARVGVGEQLDNLVSGRAAARSYGVLSTATTGSVKRTG